MVPVPSSILTLSGAWLVTVMAAYIIEHTYALPRLRAGRPLAGYLLSALLVTAVYVFWFALSWRPVFTFVATMLTLVIVARISNFKYQELIEPLSFADFLLVPQILRHPHLYQADFLWTWRFGAVLALGMAAIAGWFQIETSLLPPGLIPDILAITAGLIVAAGIGLATGCLGILPVTRDALARLLPKADVRQDTQRLGLFAGFAGHLARWIATPPGKASPGDGAAHPTWRAVPPGGKRPPVVIAIQSESFLDLRSAGYKGPDLPNLDRARMRAQAHGRLVVPTAGAWTMRTEYSFLTGRRLDTYLFDAMDPYLRAAHRAPETLAHRLGAAGYETHFLHPFDIRFFNRHRIYPGLGFENMFSQDDFDEEDVYGFYVSDAAVGTLMLDIVERAADDVFVFCVTMENHNPWERRRLAHIQGPVEQYTHHLVNADTMLGRVIDALDAGERDAVLVFYGDHVPVMHRIAHPFPDQRTNYVVLKCGPWSRGAGGAAEREAGIEDLGEMIFDLVAGRQG